IDANGILNVSAKDLGTGKAQKITITASSGLSKEEIERMRKDAEIHAQEDKKRGEEVETRNNADALCFRCETLIKENGDKIPADVKASVEKAVADLKDALKANAPIDEIKAKQEALTSILDNVTKGMYSQQAGQQAGGAAGQQPPPPPHEDSNPSAGKKDDVIDADFTMEK
ncbi:MAG: Hsp70 family protein, partial [Kiritimatiellae bacterium]|nr:Hsp70 family protein [Kiritimatiellia bacterium]